MRKLLFLLLSISLAHISTAQTVTLADLVEQSTCKTFNCFSDFITKKGFSFYQKKDTSKFNYCIFLSEKSYTIPSDKASNYKTVAIISINGDGSVATGFRTAVAAQYVSLMGQLKLAGFTVRSTTTVGSGKVLTYLSVNYPKIKVLVATNSQVNMGSLLLPYSITLVRYP